MLFALLRNMPPKYLCLGTPGHTNLGQHLVMQRDIPVVQKSGRSVFEQYSTKPACLLRRDHLVVSPAAKIVQLPSNFLIEFVVVLVVVDIRHVVS